MPTLNELSGAERQAVTIAQDAYTGAVSNGQSPLSMSSDLLDGTPGSGAAYAAWELLIAIGVLETPFAPSPMVPDNDVVPREVALVASEWIPGDTPLATLQGNLTTALLAQF